MTQGAHGADRRSGRVVISSLTGKPIPWDDDERSGDARSDGARAPRRGDERPLIPDRASEDAPEAEERSGHDAEILRDVPPHWGTGA
ncbi:hypothetical protein Bra3105_15585 [Brachybacterium halotolerans subsp. kimchii]|uniref:Uncharacterized protein n=1 Tax=Brachybacterium halotolerans TaxID=2795215 RepID=A0ABS1B9G1_9MICO|nr:hypothetical protein [Brachybacterium halotolerans]MBK0331294.1 hypothetical protein [Brachybacterium halotolerans]UEJ82243.1 hypothetical protein Bra3105_15585 [Brachybacterium halotolerans subsp. kimchii]